LQPWSLGAQQEPEPPKAASTTQTQHQPELITNSGLRSIFDDAVKVYSNEKAANAPAEDRKERREESDLFAQWQQVRWARWAAIFAAIGLFANTTAIGLVWLTFRETRRTADASVRSADAAVKAAEAAEASIQTNRAWVYHAGFRSFEMENGRFGGVPFKTGLGFGQDWKNAGATPALECDLYGEQRVVSRGAPIPTFKRGDAQGPSKTTTIGPGQPFNGGNHGVVDGNLKAYRNKEIDVYIYALITYRDIYGPTQRHTEICVLAVYNGEISGPNGETLNINFVPTGPQNTAS